MPTFAFDMCSGLTNEAYYQSVPIKPWSPQSNESLKISQVDFDSGNIVMSLSNENYIPPPLPTLAPITFGTFKKLKNANDPISQAIPDLSKMDPSLSFQNDPFFQAASEQIEMDSAPTDSFSKAIPDLSKMDLAPTDSFSQAVTGLSEMDSTSTDPFPQTVPELSETDLAPTNSFLQTVTGLSKMDSTLTDPFPQTVPELSEMDLSVSFQIDPFFFADPNINDILSNSPNQNHHFFQANSDLIEIDPNQPDAFFQ